jgi:hypothetical protein
VADNAVYNGMPAGELGELDWRLAVGRAGQAGSGVELAKLPDGHIAVRISADQDGPAVIYTRAEFVALFGGAQDGDFDALLS